MNFFNIFKRKKKKINELSVFEEFRFELKKEERERVDSLKKDLKKQPFSTSGYLLIGAIVSPFAGEGKKFYSQTSGDLTTVFRSSIRDSAINQVSQNIREKNKRAFDYKKDELEKLILKEESKIKKRGRIRILKAVVMAHLGIGVLPNLWLKHL